MVASDDPGLGMWVSARHHTSALVVYKSSGSWFPAFITHFFEGSTDLSMASEPKLQRLGLGMGSSSSSLSSEATPSSDYWPSGLDA